MVLVTMGNQDTTYTLLLISQVTCIGNNQINAKHFLIGKHHSNIDNDDVVTVFNDHHILANFSQPSERDKSNFFCCQGTKNLLTTQRV